MSLPKIRRRGDQHPDRGQAMVEFALILVPLMMLFMGIIQFGLLFSSQLGLINSTREGARYGATLITDGTNATTTAAQVYCYTLGMTSSGAACSIGGVVQAGTLGRAMPGYNPNNVCRTSGGACGTAVTSVGYCYYANPDGTTYSLRLNVTVAYRHPLIVPLISSIVDGMDGGTTDSALTTTTAEQFRVEGPSLTSVPAGISQCTS
jgi:Flp pilus assembly protein TadG